MNQEEVSSVNQCIHLELFEIPFSIVIFVEKRNLNTYDLRRVNHDDVSDGRSVLTN